MTRAAAILLSLVLVACSSAPVPLSHRGEKKNTPDDVDRDPEVPESPDPGDPATPAGACAAGASAALDTSSLDPFFTAQMKSANVSGLSVAVVGGGRIKWAKGYGLANIAEN